MPFPPLIEELAPETIGEDLITLTLNQLTLAPRAFSPVIVDVDYARTLPDGVVLPLELVIQAPSPSGYIRRIIRRLAPADITFTPREGGTHLVMLRELWHNRWLGKLRVPVAGDPLNPPRLA